MNMLNAAKSIFHPTNDMINMNKDHSESYVHLSDGKILKRDKRYLLFSGGGISKVRTIIIDEMI